jgi:hypothetical protein
MRFSASLVVVTALLAQESLAGFLNHHHFFRPRSAL